MMDKVKVRELSGQLLVDISETKTAAGAIGMMLDSATDDGNEREEVNKLSHWLFDSLSHIAKNADELIRINKGPVGRHIDESAAQLPITRSEFLPSAFHYLVNEATTLLGNCCGVSWQLIADNRSDYFDSLSQQETPAAFTPTFWQWLAESTWEDPVAGVAKLNELAAMFDDVLQIPVREVNSRIRAELARLELNRSGERPEIPETIAITKLAELLDVSPKTIERRCDEGVYGRRYLPAGAVRGHVTKIADLPDEILADIEDRITVTTDK